MAKLSDELISKLKRAKDLDEVKTLLKAEGQDEALAGKIWKEIETLKKKEGKELSMEELEAVAGGVKHRSWLEKGCAATVEDGSDCWFTDGGCAVCNIDYDTRPCPNGETCPFCGSKKVGFYMYSVPCIYGCRSCKAEWIMSYGKAIRKN